ncbi:hypothetical protein BV25DRAFT_1915764 [Artomyces pyxidatus]|uniref:Uncharacterized protein n=1 Tax=Artomyces pyxidatus TaxID=48021 RepID=A0ACB8T4I3_9AGAM|nr:hypothetical protein BV25DRAFT_1915764 [Artomyces pyxidatus]
MEQAIVAAIAPDTGDRLAEWTPENVASLTESSIAMSLLLQVDERATPGMARSMSVESVMTLGTRIWAYTLFGCHSIQELKDHPIFLAMKTGFHWSFTNGKTVAELLLTDEFRIELVAAGMSQGRRLVSPAQVISLLTSVVDDISGAALQDSPGYDPAINYSLQSGQWMQRLRRFLQASGNPHLGSSAHPSDPAHRARLFLRYVCDEVYLPPDREDRIKINFISFLPMSTLESFTWVTKAGLHAHTCFYKLDVVLNAELVNSLLADPIPEDPSIPTNFDLQLYGVISEPTTTYNSA